MEQINLSKDVKSVNSVLPDDSGNVAIELIKALSVSGTTITVTKQDGSTYEFNTQDTTYTHPNSGVGAGTYKSVTVNTQGHVTSGSNPNTLAGFGITDARRIVPSITTLWEDLNGVDSSDISLSQAYTNFDELIVVNAYDNGRSDVDCARISVPIFHNLMSGKLPSGNTPILGTGSNPTNQFVEVCLGNTRKQWFIATYIAGSTTTFFKHTSNDESKLFGVYGLKY